MDRNSLVDAARTGGLSVTASELNLPAIVGAEMRTGPWLNPATAALPTTVLGAVAAERLGVRDAGTQVWLDGQSTTVVGILEPVALAQELDIAALVGIPIALAGYDDSGNPTRVYERSRDADVLAVRELLPPSIQAAASADVVVSRPSDALAARTAVDDVFTELLLALGSISLLAGAALGAAVSGAIATSNGWVPVVPLWILVTAVAATIAIGAIAGLHPAIRAARTPPSVALSS
ncbi:hypothetical protein FHX48_000607 [Microbacterium halimionae]|uniref:ABC transport system permease protein n=1 Tax=Microbacterium halimionae TaxID=1526413 RepID=A0A7W3JMG8_9MICO|nr:hypothetical protein [Microbacterium halimionae]MBA8815555.1 hypothetical protein [Microbacterium halimionae]NII95602.1 hypothetical protein [Microbacterium halimionae]